MSEENQINLIGNETEFRCNCNFCQNFHGSRSLNLSSEDRTKDVQEYMPYYILGQDIKCTGEGRQEARGKRQQGNSPISSYHRFKHSHNHDLHPHPFFAENTPQDYVDSFQETPREGLAAYQYEQGDRWNKTAQTGGRLEDGDATMSYQ
jgi:hypothetical protein